MTSRWRCWEDDESRAQIVDDNDVDDAEGAALVACEHWETGGRWVGEAIPDRISVLVRDMSSDVLHVVEVEPQYDVSFWMARSTIVEKP